MRIERPVQPDFEMVQAPSGEKVHQLKIPMPGFKLDDINVSLKNNKVHVSAVSQGGEGGSWQSKSHSSSYTLPVNAAQKPMKTSMTPDGYFMLHLPVKESVQASGTRNKRY